MEASKKALAIFAKVKHFDLLFFAQKAGNKQIYLDFINEQVSLKEISEYFNLNKEYKEYKELFHSLHQSKNDKITTTNNYERFLMEKICFPNGIDDNLIKETPNTSL